MSEADEPQFLYLTTIGRKSGKPHQIEIWFVEHQGRYYMIHENDTEADWMKNIGHTPAVTLSIGSRDAKLIEGTGRLLDRVQEPELAAAVAALMDAKYEWSDGSIVELKPNSLRSEAHGSI